MYANTNFKTKKALKEAVARGDKVGIHNPGVGEVPTAGGEYFLEGPHYPKPHTWYAQVRLDERGWIKEIK